jgi:hypothetical protein
MPSPCHDPAMAWRSHFQKGIFVAWQGNGMVCVNQTWPHCVNQMGKTQSKPLAERHGMCESALKIPLKSQYIFSLLLFVAKNIDLYESNSEIHNINTTFSSDLHSNYKLNNSAQKDPFILELNSLITFLLA